VNLIDNAARDTRSGMGAGRRAPKDESPSARLRPARMSGCRSPTPARHSGGQLGKIFEPLLRPRQGVASACRRCARLVEQQGGTIDVEKHGGDGTTFTVLAAAQHGRRTFSQTPRLRLQPEEAIAMYTKPARIMIVDDDQDLAESLADLLAGPWYDVDIAEWQDALEHARAQISTSTLMDVRMPVMNGVTASGDQEDKAQARIVMMTGFKEPILERADQRGRGRPAAQAVQRRRSAEAVRNDSLSGRRADGTPRRRANHPLTPRTGAHRRVSVQRWNKNAMIVSCRDGPTAAARDSEDTMPRCRLDQAHSKGRDDGFDDEVAFTADLTRVPSLRGPGGAGAGPDGAGNARPRADGRPLENQVEDNQEPAGFSAGGGAVRRCLERGRRAPPKTPKGSR